MERHIQNGFLITHNFISIGECDRIMLNMLTREQGMYDIQQQLLKERISYTCTSYILFHITIVEMLSVVRKEQQSCKAGKVKRNGNRSASLAVENVLLI